MTTIPTETPVETPCPRHNIMACLRAGRCLHPPAASPGPVTAPVPGMMLEQEPAFPPVERFDLYEIFEARAGTYEADIGGGWQPFDPVRESWAPAALRQARFRRKPQPAPQQSRIEETLTTLRADGRIRSGSEVARYVLREFVADMRGAPFHIAGHLCDALLARWLPSTQDAGKDGGK